MINTKMLETLQTAPEAQLDPSMKAKLNNITGLSDKETVEAVFDVMQTSIHCGLASDFMIVALKSVLQIFCGECNFNYEEMAKESAERCIKEIE